jgi:AcrR family transcriptional regulator
VPAASRTRPRAGPRRRASAEATRGRLLSAGRRAFARKGLAGTNLRDDVLGPAGVSVGSFYHQFRDKTELLLAILEEHGRAVLTRVREAHAPAPGLHAEDIARRSYSLVFELAEENADLLRILMRERDSDDPRVRRFLRRDRERWQRSLADDYERLMRASGVRLDAELAAQMILALSLGAVAHWLELPDAERPGARERWLDGLVRFTLAGLAGLALPLSPAPPARPSGGSP